MGFISSADLQRAKLWFSKGNLFYSVLASLVICILRVQELINTTVVFLGHKRVWGFYGLF